MSERVRANLNEGRGQADGGDIQLAHGGQSENGAARGKGARATVILTLQWPWRWITNIVYQLKLLKSCLVTERLAVTMTVTMARTARIIKVVRDHPRPAWVSFIHPDTDNVVLPGRSQNTGETVIWPGA
jgi:hypothetical protein